MILVLFGLTNLIVYCVGYFTDKLELSSIAHLILGICLLFKYYLDEKFKELKEKK